MNTTFYKETCFSLKKVVSISLMVLFMGLGFQIRAMAEPSPEAKSLFKRSMDFNSKKDFGTALNYFMKAYQMSPEILGEHDQGLLDNATSFLKARVAQSPDNAENHFQLAELFALRGIDKEAIKHYKQVIKLAPNGPLALLAESEVSKIDTEAQQRQAQIAVAIANTPAPPPEDPKIAELQRRLETLQDDVRSLKKKLKQTKLDEKEKFEKYEQMEKDYKQLRKDSALWKLTYTKWLSEGGTY